MKLSKYILPFVIFALPVITHAQAGIKPKANDVTAPLHALKPDYKIPYGAPAVSNVTEVLNRIYNYLNAVTPAQFVDKRTGKVISDITNADTNIILKQGDFRLTSYEWGVTYSGMLQAGEATGDAKFTNYTKDRLNFIAGAVPAFYSLYERFPNPANPLRQPVAPHALDDAGAVCAAMIKTLRSGGNANLRPVIDNLINYISTKEFRLPDGTLARTVLKKIRCG